MTTPKSKTKTKKKGATAAAAVAPLDETENSPEMRKRSSSPEKAKPNPNANPNPNPNQNAIIKSKRFGIGVRRPAYKEGEFADDEVYWEAARLATQDTQEEDGGDDDTADTDTEMEGKEKEKQEADEKKKKKKQKKNGLKLLQERYKEYIADMSSPNFNVGGNDNATGGGNDNNDNDGDNGDGEASKDDSRGGTKHNDKDFAWLTQNMGKLGAGAAPSTFSPGDMSRVSTIPPTPLSSKTVQTGQKSISSATRSGKKSGDGDGGDSDNDNDNDNHIDATIYEHEALAVDGVHTPMHKAGAGTTNSNLKNGRINSSSSGSIQKSKDNSNGEDQINNDSDNDNNGEEEDNDLFPGVIDDNNDYGVDDNDSVDNDGNQEEEKNNSNDSSPPQKEVDRENISNIADNKNDVDVDVDIDVDIEHTTNFSKNRANGTAQVDKINKLSTPGLNDSSATTPSPKGNKSSSESRGRKSSESIGKDDDDGNDDNRSNTAAVDADGDSNENDDADETKSSPRPTDSEQNKFSSPPPNEASTPPSIESNVADMLRNTMDEGSPKSSERNSIADSSRGKLTPGVEVEINDNDGDAKDDYQVSNGHDDDDDDDDDDGVGFQLASDHDDEVSVGGEKEISDVEDDKIHQTESETSDVDGDSSSKLSSENGSANEDTRSNSIKKKKKTGKRRKLPTTPRTHTRTSKKRVSFGPGQQVSNRNYKQIPVSEFEDEDDEEDDNSNVRRSKRRKFPPLAFWKNERVVYEANNETGANAEIFGEMPVVAGILTAEPTPYKKRKVTRTHLSRNDDDNEESQKQKAKTDYRMKPYNSSKLRKVSSFYNSYCTTIFKNSIMIPSIFTFVSQSVIKIKKYNFDDGQFMNIWNEAIGEVEERSKYTKHMKTLYYSRLPFGPDLIENHEKPDHYYFLEICAFSEDLQGHQLPPTKRSNGESKVFGLAAQAFNVAADPSTGLPGYITGNLVLPPKGLKDAEGVGTCAQVFTIGDCQPKSVEVALADPEVNGGKFEPKSAQRRLFSAGEMFHVPPGNIYRIENHSKKVACALYWTIIKPFKPMGEA